MMLRLSGCVDKLDRAFTASTLAWGLPSLRVFTRRGMAPQALMIGLLVGEADRVSKDAVAYSRRFGFCDLRKLIMGSNAPASTMLILFLLDKNSRKLNTIESEAFDKGRLSDL